MKPIIKIMSVAGLLLGFLSGCQQVPELESEFILKAASFNQEDTAIANQFGCSEKPQVFQFAADSTVQSLHYTCLLYTSPSPRDRQKSRMPSSA